MRRWVPALLVIVALVVALPSLAENRADPAWAAAHPSGKPTVPTVGGNCGTPALIASLPFHDTGDTCASGANIILNYGPTCAPSIDYPGPEQVWQYTAGAASAIAVSLNLAGPPASTGDLALFVVGTTCGTGSGCKYMSDVIGIGASESIPSHNYPAGTYFIHVDSYYGSPTAGYCGAFALDVTGTLPLEVTGFSVD